MERSPYYIALNQGTKLFGLPYDFALPFLGGTVLPLIWTLSIYTLVWCIIVYLFCRWAADKDEKIVTVFLTGVKIVPNTRTRKMFGGDSYGA